MVGDCGYSSILLFLAQSYSKMLFSEKFSEYRCITRHRCGLFYVNSSFSFSSMYCNLSRNMRKRTFWHVPNEDSNQPAPTISLIRVFVVLMKKFTVHTWLFKMRPGKILIRLRKCAGWSESSLGEHALRYIFWRSGSFCFVKINLIFILLHSFMVWR